MNQIYSVVVPELVTRFLSEAGDDKHLIQFIYNATRNNAQEKLKELLQELR